MKDTFTLKQSACLDLSAIGYTVEEIAMIVGFMEKSVIHGINRQRRWREEMRIFRMGFSMDGRTAKALKRLQPSNVADAYLRAGELREIHGIGNKTINTIREEAVQLMGIDMLEDGWQEKVEEWIMENPPPPTRMQTMKELLPGLNALFGKDYQKYESEHAKLYD